MPEQRCGKVRIAHLGVVPPSRPFNGSSLFCSPSDPEVPQRCCTTTQSQSSQTPILRRSPQLQVVYTPPMKTIELCTINPKKLSPKIAEAKSGHVWNIEALMSSRRLWRPTAKSCRQLRNKWPDLIIAASKQEAIGTPKSNVNCGTHWDWHGEFVHKKRAPCLDG